MIERDQDALDVLRGSQEQALDAAVPIRTSPRSLGEVSKDPRPELDPRAALVLLHADGVSSIAEIASETKIPISETIATILELVWKGFIELGSTNPIAGPISGPISSRRAPSRKTTH